MTPESLSDDTTVAIPDHVLSRAAGEETVLLDLESEEYFGLEEVGSQLWSILEDGKTLREATARIFATYEVEQNTLAGDLRSLVVALAERRLVTIDDPS